MNVIRINWPNFKTVVNSPPRYISQYYFCDTRGIEEHKIEGFAIFFSTDQFVSYFDQSNIMNMVELTKMVVLSLQHQHDPPVITVLVDVVVYMVTQ